MVYNSDKSRFLVERWIPNALVMSKMNSMSNVNSNSIPTNFKQQHLLFINCDQRYSPKERARMTPDNKFTDSIHFTPSNSKPKTSAKLRKTAKDKFKDK